MTKIRTMVVDDETMARERIVGLLQQEKDIELIGECADGQQAVRRDQQQQPDLVFLDVQMPACDGFGVIQQVGAEQHAGGGVRDRLRRVRAQGVRGARHRLPAQAVRPRPLPADAAARARATSSGAAPATSASG